MRGPKKGKAHRLGLARTLSKFGYCSRSNAVKLITVGRVRVNGRVVRDPKHAVFAAGKVTIDGQELQSANRVYLMVNKPRGLVTTTRDERGRDTVYSLLTEYRQWLAPAGRLDKSSEGLILFTNDSGWAAQAFSPATHVDKTYHVQIGRVADAGLLDRLTEGIRSEGDILRAKRASIVRHGSKNSWLEIVLDEGKNRHIRRMLSEAGIEVLRLVRIGIGPLRLGDLPKGSVRELSRDEKSAMDLAFRGPQKFRSARKPQ
jgi:23S rRNA pseudouridine2605 synthase